MLKPAVLLLWIFFLASSLAQGSYYFESLSYSIETSSKGTHVACKLQIVSLETNLSRFEIKIPYPLGDMASQPTVLVGKSVVAPETYPQRNETLLRVNLWGMKVGQMESAEVRYTIRGGVDPQPGCRVEVRTLGFGVGVTEQALSLKLPKGLTISSIETPYGRIKPRGSAAILNLGGDPTNLVLVVRHTTLLDNPYAALAMAIAVLAAIAVSWFLHRTRRGKASEA